MILRCLLVASLFAASNLTLTDVSAQDDCCFQPSYHLECETQMVPQTVQRFRVAYETEYVDEKVTSYRPVLKTRYEEQEYRVPRHISETSYREENYTVWKPVVETSMREESVQQTRYVAEQREREEAYTTYRPVTETTFYQQRYAVQRPVTETQIYKQQYAVQRPVTETRYQDQSYTTYRPQTSYRAQTVDAGGYVPEQVVTPGQLQYGRYWQRDQCPTVGPLGFARYRGQTMLYPYYTAPQVRTQYAYRPNYIQQLSAQTQYVPETQRVQVPYQVQRMQTDYVTRDVPVQRTRMETNYITEKVPVQSTRMVATTQVRKIPYIVQRPVTETLTRKVPVQKRRWIQETKVRKVPIQTTRLEYVTQKRMVPVNYYEQQAIERTVRRPVTRQKYEPYNEVVMVPRPVVQRRAMSYFDPYSAAITSGYSSFSSPIISSGSPVVSESIIGSPVEASIVTAPEVSQPTDAGDSVLNAAEVFNETPQTKVMKVETEIEGPAEAADDMELESADPADAEPVDKPEIPAKGASWRIRYNPVYARRT